MVLRRPLVPIVVFSCLLVCWHCDPLPEPPYFPPDPNDQYAYFPLHTGAFVEYRVDSIVYDFAPSGGVVRDSFRTLVREETTDTLRDNTGLLLYRIERFERPDDSAPWQYRKTFFAARNATQGIRIEDNLRFLKLVFPFDRRSEWNGNLWIDPFLEIEIAGERIRPFLYGRYEVDSLDVPAVVGTFAFDSVLVVTETDVANAVERRYAKARYAKNIGLVWREQWILDSQYCNQNPPPADCLSKPWAEKAETGYILRQVMTGHN